MDTIHLVQVFFVATHGIDGVQQPPCSPNLASCNFWLFPKLKSALNGKRFDDIDAIKEKTDEWYSEKLT
jgi:hypothetical protein